MVSVIVVGRGRVYKGPSESKAEKILQQCEENGETAILFGNDDELLGACNVSPTDFPH